MKYTHYSPEASVVIVRGPDNKTIRHINALIKNNPKAGVLCTIETIDSYESPNKICVGSKDDSEEIASNIFDSLRMFDKLDVDIIYCEYFDGGNMGDAIMNRLLKAAGNKVIDLYSET